HRDTFSIAGERRLRRSARLGRHDDHLLQRKGRQGRLVVVLRHRAINANPALPDALRPVFTKKEPSFATRPTPELPIPAQLAERTLQASSPPRVASSRRPGRTMFVSRRTLDCVPGPVEFDRSRCLAVATEIDRKKWKGRVRRRRWGNSDIRSHAGALTVP